MSLVDDWRGRHPQEKGSSAKVIGMVLLLALVIILILNADKIARGFELFTGQGQGGSG